MYFSLDYLHNLIHLMKSLYRFHLSYEHHYIKFYIAVLAKAKIPDANVTAQPLSLKELLAIRLITP